MQATFLKKPQYKFKGFWGYNCKSDIGIYHGGSLSDTLTVPLTPFPLKKLCFAVLLTRKIKIDCIFPLTMRRHTVGTMKLWTWETSVKIWNNPMTIKTRLCNVHCAMNTEHIYSLGLLNKRITLHKHKNTHNIAEMSSFYSTIMSSLHSTV